MNTTPEQFLAWLAAPESRRLEFKAASQQYDSEKLARYCTALANEGGGHLILGVTDKRPRQVQGTQAFHDPGRTEGQLYRELNRRITLEEYNHEGKRVLIVHIPGRLPGTACQYRGTYLKREGEELLAMTESDLKFIFNEVAPDFSAEPSKASLTDLSPQAIAEFRRRWIKKSGNTQLQNLSDSQILHDAGLTVEGAVTNAALVLLGSQAGLTRHLAQAEIVFEYRSSDASGPAADRLELREGFFAVTEVLWNKINLRNDRQSYQQDFFRYDIPTFDEISIREAVLNAIAHREYRLSGSVFIRQYPRRLEIVSPGGLLPGITPENIHDQQNPRNRRIAEVLAKAGLVERSGQGMNLMIERAIRQTKPLPDFNGTAAHEVRLTLPGTVQSPAFLKYLENLGDERLAAFTTQDYMALDALHTGKLLTPQLQDCLPVLLEAGAVESQGKGRGVRHFLSREMYHTLGEPGAYTRKRGLDHDTNKALLLKHISDHDSEGSPLSHLCQVLPANSEAHVRWLMEELRKDGLIRVENSRRWARWHLATKAVETQEPL